MTDTAVADATPRAVARPLPVLVPLIKRELEQGYDAGIEHYRRAGEMLNEAREQVEHGQWGRWLAANFELSSDTAGHYMKLASADRGRHFPSLRQATRPEVHSKVVWQRPVQEVIKKVNFDALRAEKQAKEKEARLIRQLALQLIDIGYKVLATKLHPDKPGGSAEAMSRLNTVRALLKKAV